MGRNDIRTLNVPLAPPLPPAVPPGVPERPSVAADGTQAGPALAVEQFLGMSACRPAPPQPESAPKPATAAGSTSCPQCRAALSSVEQRMARCLSCGQPLEAPGAKAGTGRHSSFTVGI